MGVHTSRPRRNSTSKRMSDSDLSEGAISRMHWQHATRRAAATCAGISATPALPRSAKCQNVALSMHKNSAPVSPALAVYVCTLPMLTSACSPTMPPCDLVLIKAPQSSASSPVVAATDEGGCVYEGRWWLLQCIYLSLYTRSADAGSEFGHLLEMH